MGGIFGQSSVDPSPKIGVMVNVAGRQVHVLRRGTGAPVVLLHGNGGLAQEILAAFPPTPGICWIAPDRPGYGFSDKLPDGQQDPNSQTPWLDDLLSALEAPEVVLVAHSLAAATAVAFADARPARVKRLVLLAPFCRPTPEKLMLGLRLTTVPVLGSLLRAFVVPFLARRFRRQIIAAIAGPKVPRWLQDFPVEHAAQSKAVKTMAAELTSFNAAMTDLAPSLSLSMPVSIVHGLNDKTAAPAWHVPWLLRHLLDWDCTLLSGCGHAVHHEAPQIVIQTVLHRPNAPLRVLQV